MKFTTLGASGTVVSQCGLGTMTFGAEIDEQASHVIIDAFVARGGNFVDTADVYSDGASETIIGRWLRGHPTEAQDLVIGTKARFPMGQGPNDVGLSRRHLNRALDASLRRLDVPVIDLYQLHGWDEITPLDETLRFLDDAVRAGKILHHGFSNHLGWQIAKAAERARAYGFAAPITVQPQYNLLARDIEHEVVPAALDAGLGLLPWSPLAGGWLTGKYVRDQAPAGATRLGENPARGMEAWEARNADERTWAVLGVVAKIADAHGVDATQIALAWLLARPGVSSVVLGVRTVAQLTANLDATEVQLTQADHDRLDEVSTPLVGDYPYGPAGAAQRARSLQLPGLA